MEQRRCEREYTKGKKEVAYRLRRRYKRKGCTEERTYGRIEGGTEGKKDIYKEIYRREQGAIQGNEDSQTKRKDLRKERRV